MAEGVEKVPAETRWSIATRALTGAITVISKAMRDVLGQERYNEVWGEIWAEHGRAAKQIADDLGLSGGDAKSAAETAQLVIIAAMGPEFKFETVEATAQRAVITLTAGPWWNRRQELGISEDLCSVACAAFWDALTRSLNPKLTVKLTKAIPRGDPYCEWVLQLQK